jgi:hypothetical protein
VPTLPLGIGCAGADGNSYLGKQFGNLPSLHKLLHLKTLQKALNEQIYVLIQGKLSDALRPVPYDARAVQLTNEVATLETEITSVVNEVTGDINASIDFVNEKVAAVNEAKALIESVPAGARTAVQKLMLERYGRYAQELNAQIGRLQSALSCVQS